jgi:IS5 family transposase
MSGLIIDASIDAAPRSATPTARSDIKEGRIPAEWVNKPANAAPEGPRCAPDGQMHQGQARRGGGPRVDLAVPAFGYQNHIGIDRRHRLIRRWMVRDAARHDGALLPELIDRNNTAGDVRADTAYRSKANEKFLADRLPRSQIHRKTPKGKPMPRRIARANARKSAGRPVEHVFARQKGPMGLFIRTIGIARARTKIGLANLVCNMQPMAWLIERERTDLSRIIRCSGLPRTKPDHRSEPESSPRQRRDDRRRQFRRDRTRYAYPRLVDLARRGGGGPD